MRLRAETYGFLLISLLAVDGVVAQDPADAVRLRAPDGAVVERGRYLDRVLVRLGAGQVVLVDGTIEAPLLAPHEAGWRLRQDGTEDVLLTSDGLAQRLRSPKALL